ncbi:MAG: HEAT repeat domain-containing protein, partial [Planctomycetaceae bacterium]
EASQAYGADLRQLVEPALATWGNALAKTVWIERIGTAETRPRDLILAIRGLGETAEQSVLSDLLSVTSDLTRNPQFRLEAAIAAGKIAETGLEQHADRLARNTRTPLFVNQLCAIRLLARHSSEGARQLLIDLASHEEPVVDAAALQRLNEIDSSLVLPLAKSAIQSSDPQVRRQGAMCMLRLPAVSHIAPLSKLLADPHPGLRREICEALLRLSEQPELGELIRDAALQVLAGDSWQGQEQAALLLGVLEHQPAADRLVELLESPRLEVRLPVAWALRKVAVQETIPALIDQARRLTVRRRNEEQPGLDEQVAHLFEALGVLHAVDATPLLLEEYVPKRAGWHLSRGAAIWALGRLNEGTRDAEIEAALTERILDFEPQPTERLLVKQMCAIALGRMQAVDQAPMMRQYATSDDVQIAPSDSAPSDHSNAVMRLNLALRWAVRELTGEELPPPNPLTVGQGSWFLEPLQ